MRSLVPSNLRNNSRLVPPDKDVGAIKPKTGLSMIRPEITVDLSTSCITALPNSESTQNCAKWLQRLGAEKDLDVQLGYPMAFSDDEPFPIYIKNLDRVCNNYGEYRRAYGELLCTENKL